MQTRNEASLPSVMASPARTEAMGVSTQFSVERYRELHGNTKPVDRAALALSKEKVKLPWGKQEPNTEYGLSIVG